jgi:penicillin-binding protein 2
VQQDNTRQRIFTRRTVVLAGGQLTLFGLLIARMYHLQVLDREKYQTLADENRISMRVLAPQRGRVVDRFGEHIAYNEINYRAIVVAEQTGDVATTLDVLNNIIPLTDAERRRVLREVSRKRRFVPVLVRENLTWDDVAKIAVNAADLPGISVDVGSTRKYPFGPDFAHIVGYVTPPSAPDLERDSDPVLEQPGFRLGRSGLERSFELALRGRGGSSQLEVNALGRPIRELSRREGDSGQDLVLTVDRELQQFAAQRLQPQDAGAAVLMEVRTGEVLASANTPSFDPNEFNRGISETLYRSLNNKFTPLINKFVAGQYAPGSTFKIVTSLAALESGTVSGDFRFSCPGHMDFGDNRFHCWKRGGHGGLDMVSAIHQSCDVYFYEVAKRTGVDAIAAMARRLGLGQLLNTGFNEERGGIIPTRDWKVATLGQPWAQGETLVAGIGQGFIVATPLQLAVMTSRVVNGGYAVTPRFTRDLADGRRLVPRTATQPPSLGISAKSLGLLMRGLVGVVNDPRGTAFRQRVTEPGMQFGGKSGTSQVRRITQEERQRGLRPADKLPWVERDHALFVAFAPVDAPRYACAVVIEHGGGGSGVAAPIARDILVEAIKRERTRPQPLQRVAASAR